MKLRTLKIIQLVLYSVVLILMIDYSNHQNIYVRVHDFNFSIK